MAPLRRGVRNSRRASVIFARCRDLDRPRVLDVGCGTGQTLVHLADVVTCGVGVDISPAMISRARRNATMRNLSFSIGDAVDFCSSCCDRFELVWLVGVLGHLPDQGAMLAAAHGVLTSRGRLIVISVHPWNPWTRIKRLMDGGCEAPPADDPSPSRLCRLAEQNGFGLIGLEPLPYAAWPELAAVRGRGGTSIRAPRDHAWTGLLRGALAAEFDRRGC